MIASAARARLPVEHDRGREACVSKATAARRERGVLENEVLAAVAAATEPLTPAAVQADLGRDLAYTTIMTTLTRLCDKGLLTRARTGRAYAYTMADPAKRVARDMRRLLDQGQDRGAVLARFLDELPAEDVPILRQLLQNPPD